MGLMLYKGFPVPISVPDLIAMRDRVEADIKRLEAEIIDAQETLEAITKLEKRLRAENPHQQSHDLPLIKPRIVGSPAMTFAETVRTVVKRFNEDDFTIINIENVLKAQGAALPPNNARVRISMEVKRMVANKQVAVIEKGKGTNPFKYRYIGEPGKGKGLSATTDSPLVKRITRTKAPSLTV